MGNISQCEPIVETRDDYIRPASLGCMPILPAPNELTEIHEKLSDKIRNYCRDQYIIPARERGEKQVVLRVGTIHRELRLKSRWGSVDDALGSNMFQSVARVRRISKSGPPHASSTTFIFQILE